MKGQRPAPSWFNTIRSPRHAFALLLVVAVALLGLQTVLRSSRAVRPLALPMLRTTSRRHCDVEAVANASFVHTWPSTCTLGPTCCLPAHLMPVAVAKPVDLPAACNENAASPHHGWIKKGAFAPPCCVTRLLLLLLAAVDALELRELPYSLGLHTALAAWRFGGFNPWDSTAVLLYPASLDRAVYAAARAMAKSAPVCGVSGCTVSFPDTHGFFVSVSPGTDSLGIQFVRVWRESVANAASWKQDHFVTADKKVPLSLSFSFFFFFFSPAPPRAPVFPWFCLTWCLCSVFPFTRGRSPCLCRTNGIYGASAWRAWTVWRPPHPRWAASPRHSRLCPCHGSLTGQAAANPRLRAWPHQSRRTATMHLHGLSSIALDQRCFLAMHPSRLTNSNEADFFRSSKWRAPAASVADATACVQS